MNESLTTVIKKSIKQDRSNVYTALPARVINFNGHTVTCEIMITRIMTNGQEIEIPPLVDVPAQFPHAGGFCFTVPIKKGDEGLVIFSSRCIDGWYISGDKSKPLDNRMHDLSDGIFIVGVNSVPKKITDFYHDGASMQTDNGSTYIRLTDGKILIKGDIEHTGNSKQTGNLALMGNYQQVGSWAQQGGDAASKGTLSASKIVGGGIDLENHVHVETGSITRKPS
ncbi:Gp138 family membrane-puncturing spike protein [Orbus wheelerorum]|uniref:Gp138 family membrane-puncturing spike protein n=1 Tax=Orbus wheelerorum TaxID=3074111 RepID=UPI00370D4F1E